MTRFDIPRPAFTLVELMAVLAIAGLLAGIIVVRITGHNDNANLGACETNRTNIEVQAEIWLQDTGSWPAANLSDVGGNVNYFPSGLPTCPVDGSSYTIDTSTGRVSGHNH